MEKKKGSEKKPSSARPLEAKPHGEEEGIQSEIFAKKIEKRKKE